MYIFDKAPFLTTKQKKFLRENDIFCNLLLFLSSMFEYEGFDETIKTEWIEFYCHLSYMGCCGIFEYNGKQVLGYCSEGGMLDEYGQPEMFNINTLSVQNKQKCVDGVNSAICWNNSLHRNDLVILNRFTEKFNLLDTCETCLIKFARLFPVIEVDDSRIEHELKTAFKNSENGEPFTFTSKGLSKLGVDGQPGMNIQQLGDYTAVDKIQYLSTYYNDLLRRFYQMFGMQYENSFKQAQQSVEEVTADSVAAWIRPNDMLKCRQAFVDSYNKVFSRNASVRLSDAWSKGYDKYMSSINNEDIEEGGAE